ncbi:glycoside hydrolase family 28 protein [Alteromonas pelagimontana]|uniref:Glycoside hydrolase family 28 protein n=1 Tax=Alteromonas pelagimontana TaxID=1858656 RepID=A0A6M4MDE0_9ALTE|nr:glycoside hydrolase family 28 protein [Alteromonas pelagimontana]QJR80156.1 glycoside hydrolase family 28 protein [Alteromonas pelagimontana]
MQRFSGKYNLLSCLLIISALSIKNGVANTDADWALADSIVKEIQQPKIPDRTFTVTDFVTNGESSDHQAAIQSAINSASEAGGGKVVLPKGKWFSRGPIQLKSRVNLHLEKGATLLFSATPADYLPVVKTRWEGTEVFTYSPLIYAANVEDVAITGKGVIDGNADSAFIDWVNKQDKDVAALRSMGFNLVPVGQRQFGEGHFLRPPLIQFFHAKRVLLQDYTAINSPFWVNHLLYTSHATVKGVSVDSHQRNNDGLDIESSQHVLVENSRFRTGDDSIVIKSGRDADGRSIGIPSTDIVVRHNDLGGEDGVGLGSEMSGGIKRVFFSDNTFRKGDSAYRFKSNLDRGGSVEMVRIRNSQVSSFTNLFWFQLNYPSNLNGNFPATYTDIVFENIRAEDIGTVLEIHAPDASPVSNVTFRNIQIRRAKTPFILENAKNLTFENVQIGPQRYDGVMSAVAHNE